uniref:G-protein coupled receptors family 1 profile domain-containing protein n=1 Tax=Haplochromis burtoni TaxID=8153 RepID=A0A3Q3CVH5_HAPBU
MDCHNVLWLTFISTIISPTNIEDNYGNYSDFDYGDYAPANSTDVKEFSRAFLATLYSLVFILGFIGNGLVVCVLVKHRNQSNLTDICLFNLALSDLLFVFMLPFFSHNTRVGQWPFGDFMCRLISGSHHIGFFSSIFFMVVMTLDRYMIIVHAHRVARYRTKKAAIILTVLVWMLSLFLIICIVVVFFFLWAPYNISLFLEFLQEREIILNDETWYKNVKLSITVTEALAYTHCCLNPIIYAFVGEKFMRRALQLLKKLMPGYSRDLTDSSFRRSSVMSRGSEITSSFKL